MKAHSISLTHTEGRAHSFLLSQREGKEHSLTFSLSHTRVKTHSLLLSHTDGESTRTLTAAYTGEADTHSHALRQQGRAFSLLHRDSRFLTHRKEGTLTLSQEGGKLTHSQSLTQRQA